MSRFEVRIGDVALRDEVYDVLVQEIRYEHTRETIANITLLLDKIDPSRLNLYWRTTVDEMEGGRRRLFSGVVVETHPIDGDKLVLVCEGGERHYREYRVTYGFHGFTLQEILFYMARKVPEVEVQEKNIQGLSLNKKPRSFRVIMPILNLDVPEKTSILGVQIAPKESSSEDENAISGLFSKGNSTATDTANHQGRSWDGSRTRAEVGVEAAYFDEAAIVARERIVNALDWLSYILHLSVVGARIENRLILVPWIRDRSFATISLGEEAYVRDLSEPSLKAYLHDFEPLRGEPAVRLAQSALSTYLSLMEQFEAIYDKQSEVSRRFWLAMHWLRRARQSIDEGDRLLALWIALEFLVSGSSGDELCNCSQTHALCEDLQHRATELGVKDVALVIRRFRDAVNQPSLHERFDAFVKAHSIFIEEREESVVWGPLRSARNDLEHGKKQLTIASEDLDLLDQMLSKMIWMVANRIDRLSAANERQG